ncbi:MAG: hypothetical protein M3680_21775 [Myxococcota bacterium]|nr:hypothetical protein [Myxococcota bacterium]
MERDARRAFTGPPELGALLEAVLVFDEMRRLPVDELRTGLAALARRWTP